MTIQLQATNIHKRFGIFVEPGTERPPNMPFYRNLPGYRSEGVEAETHYEQRGGFASLSMAWMRGEHRGSIRNPWADKNQPLIDIASFGISAHTFGLAFQGLV